MSVRLFVVISFFVCVRVIKCVRAAKIASRACEKAVWLRVIVTNHSPCPLRCAWCLEITHVARIWVQCFRYRLPSLLHSLDSKIIRWTGTTLIISSPRCVSISFAINRRCVIRFRVRIDVHVTRRRKWVSINSGRGMIIFHRRTSTICNRRTGRWCRVRCTIAVGIAKRSWYLRNAIPLSQRSSYRRWGMSTIIAIKIEHTFALKREIQATVVGRSRRWSTLHCRSIRALLLLHEV